MSNFFNLIYNAQRVILVFLNEISFVKLNINLYKIFISTLLFIFVALSEEVMFRGYILKNLMLSFNKYIALIVSSLLFATIHIGNPNMTWFSFLNIALAGVFLGLSYIYTKNLWFPIALHLSWNLFQTLLGFKVSGQGSYSIVEFNINENNLLNGGDFGFEGSLLSLVFMLIAIVFIYKYYKKQEN